MSLLTIVRLACIHARNDIIQMLLIAFVVSLSATPAIVGIRLSALFNLALRDSIDTLEVRKIVVGPRDLTVAGKLSTDNMLSTLQLHQSQVEYACPLVEIATTFQVSEGEMAYSMIEGVLPQDPRFARSRLLQGNGFTGKVPDGVVLSQGLSHLVRDGTVNFTIARVISGREETQNITVPVVGIEKMAARRAYMPLDFVTQMEAWGYGAEFDTNAVRLHRRGVLFLRDQTNLCDVLERLQTGGWETQHRLSELERVSRILSYINLWIVGSLAPSMLSAFSILAIYLTASHAERTAAIQTAKMASCRFFSICIMFAGPTVVSAAAAFVLSALGSGLLIGQIWQISSELLGLEQSLAGFAKIDARTLCQATLLVFGPLLSGVALSQTIGFRANPKVVFGNR